MVRSVKPSVSLGDWRVSCVLCFINTEDTGLNIVFVRRTNTIFRPVTIPRTKWGVFRCHNPTSLNPPSTSIGCSMCYPSYGCGFIPCFWYFVHVTLTYKRKERNISASLFLRSGWQDSNLRPRAPQTCALPRCSCLYFSEFAVSKIYWLTVWLLFFNKLSFNIDLLTLRSYRTCLYHLQF